MNFRQSRSKTNLLLLLHHVCNHKYKQTSCNKHCLFNSFGSSSNSQLSFLRFLIISESDFFSSGERSLACNVYHFLISNNKYAGAVVSKENCLESAFTFTISTLVSTFGSGSGETSGPAGCLNHPRGQLLGSRPTRTHKWFCTSSPVAYPKMGVAPCHFGP